MKISKRNMEEFGTPESRCLQVRNVAGMWIVEDPFGEGLAEASTREEAIVLARALGDALGSSEINVEAGNGASAVILNV